MADREAGEVSCLKLVELGSVTELFPVASFPLLCVGKVGSCAELDGALDHRQK